MLLQAILFLVLLFFILRKLRQLEISDLDKKAVFITGCDTGFGHGLALKCLSRGMPVFAGCFTEKGADDLRKKARDLPGTLETLLVDISKDESVSAARKVLEEKTKKYGGLYGLVNNAGIVGAPFLDDLLILDDYKKNAEVNVWGAIRVTQAMKPLVKKTKGRIVTVTSTCARLSIMANGPYNVSKHAISAYCDTIRRELKPWGVSVHVLEPGLFNTPLTDRNHINETAKAVWERSSPELRDSLGLEFFEKSQEILRNFMEMIGSDDLSLVVDAYFHALTARFPHLRYPVGWDSHLLWVPLSLLPTRLQDAAFYLGLIIMRHPMPAELKK